MLDTFIPFSILRLFLLFMRSHERARRGKTRRKKEQKAMPIRKPPKCYDESRHYGGNHVLFHNNSTSKLFPQLAAIPQSQLATMFNMPMIDKEEEKLKELEYCEPHQDRRINFRSQATPSPFFGSSSGKNQPGAAGSSSQRTGTANSSSNRGVFVPVNPSKAKDEIAVTRESVLVGTYYDQVLAQKRDAEAAAAARERVSSRSFTSASSALQASERIQTREYLLAVDTDVARQVRELTQHRIKVNREILEERARSAKNSSSQRAPGRPRADSPPKGLK
jgi:hypothetical protein